MVAMQTASLVVLALSAGHAVATAACDALGGNGTTKTDSKGTAYTLGCDQDMVWAGNDVTSVAASGFDQCFDICTANAQCGMFAYNIGKCWLKSIPTDPNSRPKSLQGVDMAWRSDKFPRSCSAMTTGGNIYIDDSGKRYEIGCGKDLAFVGDYAQVNAPAYESCFNICTKDSRCKVFSWWKGTCYLKDLPTNGQKPTASQDGNLAWVEGAFSASSTTPAATTAAATTAAATTAAATTPVATTPAAITPAATTPAATTPAATTPAPSATPTNRSCNTLGGIGASYTAKNGQGYILGCGRDSLFDGDLVNFAADSFEQCFDMCQQNSACKAFTFNIGKCWLKNPSPAVRPRVIQTTSSGPDMAWKVGFYPQSTCPQSSADINYTNQKGTTFDFLCDTNIEGGVLSTVKVTNGFDSCFSLCGNAANCNAFTFDKVNSACILKFFTSGTQLTLSPNNNYDTAAVPDVLTAGLSKSQTGSWGSMIEMSLVPVAAAYVPGYDRVLVWASTGQFQVTGDGKNNPAQTWMGDVNYQTGETPTRLMTETQHNMFCPGISTDQNGRIIVSGGATDNAVSIYDPSKRTWSAGGKLINPRGYHASATMSNGNIFVIGGAWNDAANRQTKKGEYYNVAQNQWYNLPNCDTVPMLTNDAEGVYRADNHAWLFGWKNGAILQAGPSKAMNWYTAAGSGTTASAGNKGGSDAMNGNAIMYDAGKIITAGGAPSYTQSGAVNASYHLTLGNSGAAVTVEKMGGLAYPRAHLNSVVLPTGEVVFVGGQAYSVIFEDSTPVLYPEIWSPVTRRSTRMHAKEGAVRVYHSVALLLPDGTVFSGGGGACGDGCSANHPNAQIYTPPYLYRGNSLATRPTITAISGSAFKPGQSLTVNVTISYASAATFALVRVGTATHSINSDQRRLSITPTARSGNRYTLTLPSDSGVLIPGSYFVFAMDSNVPSVAKVITVGL